MDTAKVRELCQKEGISCAPGNPKALWEGCCYLAPVTPSQHQVAPSWVFTKRFVREALMMDNDYILSVKNDYARIPLRSVTSWTVRA